MTESKFNPIQGDRELLRKFQELSELKQEQIMRKQAEVVRTAAVLRVPVDTGSLRTSIHHTIAHENGRTQGVVYTNKKYAPYVEFGTGPAGQANHAGTDPAVNVTYRQSPWVYYDKRKNQFFTTEGQPARPYMYPALKDSEKAILRGIREDINAHARKVSKS